MATSRARHLFRASTLASLVSLVSLVSLASLSAVVPRLAYADTKSAAAHARAAELFKASAESYRQGDFKHTVELLDEAYALDPQPVVLYNLGRAYEGSGDSAKAIDAYQRYLAADPKAPDRPSLEQRMATLQRQQDEKQSLEKQRDDEKRRAETAAEEQRRAEERAQNQQQRVEPPRSRSVAPYVVAGVGAVGLVAGGVLGLVATSKHDSAVTEHVQKAAMDDQDQAKSLATASTVSFIAGGVLLAAGVAWWVLDTPPKRTQGSRATTRVGVAPSFVTIERSF